MNLATARSAERAKEVGNPKIHWRLSMAVRISVYQRIHHHLSLLGTGISCYSCQIIPAMGKTH